MKLKITFFLLLLASFVNAQNLNFSTFDFSAEINGDNFPNCEITSLLDPDNNTHIVWVKTVGNFKSLMYSVYDNESVTTELLVAGNENEILAAPNLILDENENPHIVYFKRRDKNSSIVSGNYAVMYIGDGNGDGIFTSSQVSTNSTNPTDNSSNIYNCFTNGRPSISASSSGEILVLYYSEANSSNSFENYIIGALGDGSTWTHQQLYSLDDLPGGEPLASNDIDIDRRGIFADVHGFIEIADENPMYVIYDGNNWLPYRLTSYGGFGNVTGGQIEVDENGNNYLFWHTDTSATFYKAEISTTGFGIIEEMPIIGQKSAGSNFRPSVLDDVTGKWWASYIRFTEDLYITTKNNNNQVVEALITDAGTYQGKKSLNVRDGFVSLVTASESDAKIYITTNGATSTSVDKNKSDNITINPNPANDFINIKLKSNINSVEVYDLNGRLVLVGDSAELNIKALNNGMYMMKAITDEGVYTTRFVKE